MRLRSLRGRSAGRGTGLPKNSAHGTGRTQTRSSQHSLPSQVTRIDLSPETLAQLRQLFQPTNSEPIVSVHDTSSIEDLIKLCFPLGKSDMILPLAGLLFLCGLWTGCSWGSASAPTRVPPEPSTSTSGSTRDPSSTEPIKPRVVPRSGSGKDNWTPLPSTNSDCPGGSPCQRWVPS